LPDAGASSPGALANGLSLNFEVEDRKYVVLFRNQQSVRFQSKFDEVGLIPLKALKPKEIGKIGRTNIGIEVKAPGFEDGLQKLIGLGV